MSPNRSDIVDFKDASEVNNNTELSPKSHFDGKLAVVNDGEDVYNVPAVNNAPGLDHKTGPDSKANVSDTLNGYQTRQNRKVQFYARRKAKEQAALGALHARCQGNSMYFNHHRFEAEAYKTIINDYYTNNSSLPQVHRGFGQRANSSLAEQMLRKWETLLGSQFPSSVNSKHSSGPAAARSEKDDAIADVMTEGGKGVKKKGLKLFQAGKKQWSDIKWQAKAKKAEMLYLLKENGMNIAPIVFSTAKEIIKAIHEWKASHTDRESAEEEVSLPIEEASEDEQPRLRKRKRDDDDDSDVSDLASQAEAEAAHARKKAKLSIEDRLHNLSHEDYPVQNPRVVLIKFTKRLPEESSAPHSQFAPSSIHPETNIELPPEPSNRSFNLLKQTITNLYCDENEQVHSISSPGINNGDLHRPFAISTIDENAFEIWGDVLILVNVLAGVQDALRSGETSVVDEERDKFRELLADGLSEAKAMLAGEGGFTDMEIEVL